MIWKNRKLETPLPFRSGYAVRFNFPMHNVYRHLKSYGFKNFKTADDHLCAFSEPRLEAFLNEYVALVQKSPVMAPPLAGATDIYPDSRASSMISPTTLKRLALYANRIYVHDDLLESCLEWPELDGVHQMSPAA